MVHTTKFYSYILQNNNHDMPNRKKVKKSLDGHICSEYKESQNRVSHN